MGKTILIVDDAAVMRQMYVMTLKREGFAIIEGVNGKDALTKIDGVSLSLVITDINMPEMDGIELIKELRSRQDTKFVPIIVLSTVSQEKRVQEGREAGASGWLLKPFDGKKLLETVKKFI